MGPDGAAARAALAGAKVAVDEVNAEGGVLGEPVVLVPDESGDGSSSATTDAVRRLIDRPVDAVIGGTVYGITSVAIPELTDAGIILFSPTDTARALSVADDRGRAEGRHDFLPTTPADQQPHHQFFRFSHP